MRPAVAIAAIVLVLAAPLSGAPDDADMCKTHRVLEAVCPKCNPALGVIFRAKGDWCAEHGFPESFCPTCRPSAGGRPGMDVVGDGAPANGLKVKLRTAEAARVAGLETVKVTPRPARSFVSALVRISYDATRVAAINARAPGILRVLEADVGATVAEHAPLAVIESASTAADRSRVEAARARLALAAANRTRERSLSAQGIVARKDVLTAEQEWTAAKAELDAAEAAVRMAGGTASGGRTTLASPIAGVVTQRKATVGQLVSTDDILFEVIDTRSMWAELDIPETDIGQVSKGQLVDITIDSLPGRTFSGRLAYLAPLVNPETRTVTGRVALANPTGELRANMFGQARILVGDAHLVIPVPRGAVQRVKEVALAFVRRSDTDYETRRLKVGQTAGESVDVLEGLTAGDEVVTTGSFLLKTETLKDSIGAGCCEADTKK